jgi:hypothetical protein
MKIKTKIMCVLATAALILSLSSCKIVRSVGETLGVVDEKTEQVEPSAPNNSVPNNSQVPTTTTSSVNYGMLLIWLSVIAGLLVAARFWLKSYEDDELVEPKKKKGVRRKK